MILSKTLCNGQKYSTFEHSWKKDPLYELGWFRKGTETSLYEGERITNTQNMVKFEGNAGYLAGAHVIISHSRPVAKSASHILNNCEKTARAGQILLNLLLFLEKPLD